MTEPKMQTTPATYLLINAFAEPAAAAYSGNPAAVLLLPHFPRDAAMLAVAAELRVSETCFVVPRGAAAFALRWFTPAREVALCGHGTLAAAHAVWAAGLSAADELCFDTLAGELRVRRAGGGAGDGVELGLRADGSAVETVATLVFPSHDPVSVLPDTETLSALAAALTLAEFTAAAFDAATGKLILVARDEQAVAALTPDAAALLAVDQSRQGACVTGVAVSSPATRVGDTGFRFASRYFSPWNGIPYAAGEDPVNGSSHTLLFPFWSARLGCAGGAEAAVLSPRGGALRLAFDGDARERVRLTGAARTVCAGRMGVREDV